MQHSAIEPLAPAEPVQTSAPAETVGLAALWLELETATFLAYSRMQRQTMVKRSKTRVEKATQKTPAKRKHADEVANLVANANTVVNKRTKNITAK